MYPPLTLPPQNPATPRNGEPFYIDSDCQQCGTELVLHDFLEASDLVKLRPGPDTLEKANISPKGESSGIWHDEWVCPNCLDATCLDIPTTADDVGGTQTYQHESPSA